MFYFNISYGRLQTLWCFYLWSMKKMQHVVLSWLDHSMSACTVVYRWSRQRLETAWGLFLTSQGDIVRNLESRNTTICHIPVYCQIVQSFHLSCKVSFLNCMFTSSARKTITNQTPSWSYNSSIITPPPPLYYKYKKKIL
jgi:hypothetical protein